MAKNNGTDSESIFKDRIKKDMGKHAYLVRLTDSKSTFRNGKKGVALAATPADWVLTYFGHMGYAEVKSTQNPTSFPFSAFTKGQNAGMIQQRAAGGNYWIFIHNINTDQWYRITGELVLEVEAAGKKSLTWKELEPFKW